jgi:hypothetical protein
MRARKAGSPPLGADQRRGLRRWRLGRSLRATAAQVTVEHNKLTALQTRITKPIELAELGDLLDTLDTARAQDQQPQPASRIAPA